MTRKILNFFKAVLSGCLGAVLFFILSILVFSIVKIIFLLQNRNLFLSQYNIGAIIVAFLLVGFIFGALSYAKKNTYYKIFRLIPERFWLNGVIALVFSFIAYFLVKANYGIVLRFWPFVLLFIAFLILFYGFSAVTMHIYKAYPFTRTARRKTTFRDWILFVFLNPVFICIYLLIFGSVVYGSLFIPCGVSIVGVDRNINTANTVSLDIQQGEKLLSIDGISMNSLHDVRDYMNSLKTTKEVMVETPDRIYYVKTYADNGQRYMGLILKEDICRRIY